MTDTNVALLEICLSDSRVLCITHIKGGENVTGYLERLYELNMLDMVFLDEGEMHQDLLSDLVKGGKIGKLVPIYTTRDNSPSPWRLDAQGFISSLLRFHLGGNLGWMVD